MPQESPAHEDVEKDGKNLFKEICARDLEGIVGKRKLGIYKDDGTGWIKIKTATTPKPRVDTN